LAGLTLRLSPGGKWVTSDTKLPERVLANLIQNAMKYTVRGGVVVVARTTATHFHIEVWDTGVGIAAHELPRIFDEYYQVGGHGGLRTQGMGMGLAIVRRLVRLLGHALTVVSEPGRGTMFRLSIRQRGAPEVHDLTAPADTQPMPAGRARSVLLVEDDEPVRQGLALLLEEAGYIALPAANLEQARQLLRVRSLVA
jgi:anti-sigma regulatory factor (Ser/Thr protein kinase)